MFNVMFTLLVIKKQVFKSPYYLGWLWWFFIVTMLPKLLYEVPIPQKQKTKGSVIESNQSYLKMKIVHVMIRQLEMN